MIRDSLLEKQSSAPELPSSIAMRTDSWLMILVDALICTVLFAMASMVTGFVMHLVDPMANTQMASIYLPVWSIFMLSVGLYARWRGRVHFATVDIAWAIPVVAAFSIATDIFGNTVWVWLIAYVTYVGMIYLRSLFQTHPKAATMKSLKVGKGSRKVSRATGTEENVHDSRGSAWFVAAAIVMFFIGWVLLLCFQIRWIKIAGVTALGACQLAVLFDTYRQGVLRTNWGTARRSENPIRFRIEFYFWSAFSVLFTLLMFSYAIGLTRTKVPP